jgi:hypothetical protein
VAFFYYSRFLVTSNGPCCNPLCRNPPPPHRPVTAAFFLQDMIEPFKDQLESFELEKKALLSRSEQAQGEVQKLATQYGALLGTVPKSYILANVTIGSGTQGSAIYILMLCEGYNGTIKNM